VLEGASALTFRLVEGKTFSFRRLRQERQTLAVARTNPDSAAPNSLFMVHPYLGKVLNPRWPGVLPGENPISAYGFCDRQPPIHHRSANKVIVGLVGGSVASQLSAQGGERLIQELQQAPRFAGKKIELVNLAVRCFKQPQQVMALEYALALGGEFDVLINLDGFDEIALHFPQNASAGVSPLYPYAWYFSVAELPDPHLRRLVGECIYLEKARSRWARRFRSGPANYSITWNLLWWGRDRQLARDAEGCQLALQGYVPPAVPASATGPGPQITEEPALFRELASIWKRCSLQLHRTCRGHGIEYYHFLQPNQYVAGAKAIGSEEKKIAWLQASLSQMCVERGYPLLRNEGINLHQQGVRFHDLTQVFAGHPEAVYGDNSCSLNRHGHEVLAVAIARAMVEDHPARP
jgi:hypothetical protein